MIPLHDANPTRRLPAVTIALIAANVAVFVVQLALPRWGITLEGWYYLLGARPFELTRHVDVPPYAWFPWPATLFTALFVHGGWLHLIFNMWYLWIFGNNVEDAMTRPRFVVFYFACGLVATAAQVLAAPLSDVPLIGASGAIAGVLGGYLVLFPRQRVLTVIPLIVVWPVFEVPAWILLLRLVRGAGGERPQRRTGRVRRASRSSPTSAGSSPARRWSCCSRAGVPGGSARRPGGSGGRPARAGRRV